ncbi:MAG: hypothetical protein HKK67_08975 [Chlorobiaceae bacterium]|nr:hypothetical protein [Chlorobiaceae bacterium]NMW21746.1 hypothetical protein [Chlorobiaceae bacterium]
MTGFRSGTSGGRIREAKAAGRAIGKRRGGAQTVRGCRVVNVPLSRFQWRLASKGLTRRAANRAGVERRSPLDAKRPLRTISPYRERRRRWTRNRMFIPA